MVAHVALTPFAGGAFESANVALERVDLAAFHDGLPQTQLALALDARPRDGSVAGGFRATNALPGSLDLHRLPLTAAAGNYAYASRCALAHGPRYRARRRRSRRAAMDK